MATLIEIATASTAVTKIAAWKDRHYLSLAGFDGNFAGDRNLKIWIKGNVLTIEGAKGCRSFGFCDSLSAIQEAVVAAGGVRKGYSDTVECTYSI